MNAQLFKCVNYYEERTEDADESEDYSLQISCKTILPYQEMIEHEVESCQFSKV